MKRTELHDLCQAVIEGDTRLVQNQHLLYTGRVTACRDENLVVEAFGHTYTWDAAECREVDARTEPLGPPTSQ